MSPQLSRRRTCRAAAGVLACGVCCCHELYRWARQGKGRASGGKGQGHARASPGSPTPPPGSGRCPLCGHKMAPRASRLRFAPLTPWRLGSLCWRLRVLAPGRPRSWPLSPVSEGPGLGARVLRAHHLRPCPGLLRPRFRSPFFRSLAREIGRRAGLAAVVIAAHSPAQFPCEMPQPPTPPSPFACPWLGKAPGPWRSVHFCRVWAERGALGRRG